MFGKNNSAPQGLKIIIVGCGKVGITLVEQLSNEGNDITVIDKNAKLVTDVCDTYDVMGVVGNGATYSVQIEAGIEQADLLIAVTMSDELNLLCATVARQVTNCAAIARVRDPDYSQEVAYLREKLSLDMIINPELEAAKEASRILFLPTALEVNTFAHGQAELIKMEIPEGNILAGKTIAEVASSINMKVLICGVERGDEVFIPLGNFMMQSGDKITFTASRANVRSFLREAGFKTQQVKDTIIVGGGDAAFYLSKYLLDLGVQVKIIEIDKERCEELITELPKAIVINGDGTDEELLKEEGIADCESFVALTGMDEENILLTLYAKQVSDCKVITKITRNTFKGIINNLQLGSIIYPKYITSEAIIAYVRAKKDSLNSNIETLYHMFDHRAEAVEFRIGPKSELTDRPIKELELKDNVIIACISRHGKIIIPGGDDMIHSGDSVMIVTTHKGFDNIKDILK